MHTASEHHGNRPAEWSVPRREFLRSAGTAAVALGAGRFAQASPGAAKKVVVGAHPWVYAATRPNHDITPILDSIFADRIVFLHLRDQKADGRWSEALGEGDMDYRAIAEALHEVGFAGDAVIELAHERDSRPTRPLRESLKISRQFVRETLAY